MVLRSAYGNNYAKSISKDDILTQIQQLYDESVLHK